MSYRSKCFPKHPASCPEQNRTLRCTQNWLANASHYHHELLKNGEQHILQNSSSSSASNGVLSCLSYARFFAASLWNMNRLFPIINICLIHMSCNSEVNYLAEMRDSVRLTCWLVDISILAISFLALLYFTSYPTGMLWTCLSTWVRWARVLEFAE